MAKLQDDYIAAPDMLVVDGFIGNDPEFRVPAAALSSRSANANIAGMQQQLYFRRRRRRTGFEPELHRHLHAESRRPRAIRTTG